MSGGNFSIFVQASFRNATLAGTVSNTNVTGNTVSEAAFNGITVFVGDASGSSITRTTITNNKVMNNASLGIFVLANGSAAGANTSITNTTIRDNEVFGNTSHGIASWSFSGRGNFITGLVIDKNNVHDNDFTGIAIAGGLCGGTQNTMEATISQNTLTRNGPPDGTSGIYAAGGVSSCTGDPPVASQNQLTVTITKNTLIDNLGAGIGVIGGQVRAESNTVTPTITDNTVTGSGTGIFVGGGVGSWRTFSGSANNNKVNAATFSGNRVESTRVGIGLAGGFSGRANSNIVNAQLQGNISCGAGADIYGVGGFLGSEISPPNQGTGNEVTGSIKNNTATAILVKKGFPGNAASVQQQGNTSCSGPPGPVPVVLVHGWGGNGEICTNPGECTFSQMEALLEQNGFVGRVYVYDYSLLTVCQSPATIEQIAGDFWRWLGSSEGPGRGRQIDVVAHSMGGLVVRAYMAGMGGAGGTVTAPYGGEIRRLVMIGTPNGGITPAAVTAINTLPCLINRGSKDQAEQMRMGSSSFLQSLTSKWQSVNFAPNNILVIAGIKGNLLTSGSLLKLICLDRDTSEGDDDGVVNVNNAALPGAPPCPSGERLPFCREVPYKHSSAVWCPWDGTREAFIDNDSHLTFATLVPFLQNGTAPTLYIRRPPGGIWQFETNLFSLKAIATGIETQSATATLTWTEVPGGGLTPLSPAVAVAPNGDVYVVVQGTDNRIYLNIQRSGTWLGWAPHPSRLTGSSPAAVVDTSGNLRVFVHGVNDYIYESTYTGGGWSEWAEVPGGGFTFSAPEATVNPVTGELSLVVRGIDSQVYLNIQSGAAWSGWSALPVGGLTLSELGATYDSSGTLWLFARGIDAGIWATSNKGGNWSSWVSLGGTTYSGLAAAASENAVAVFAHGVDDRIYMNTYSSGVWSGWSEVPGGGLTPDAPAAAVDSAGNVLLFVRGE